MNECDEWSSMCHFKISSDRVDVDMLESVNRHDLFVKETLVFLRVTFLAYTCLCFVKGAPFLCRLSIIGDRFLCYTFLVIVRVGRIEKITTFLTCLESYCYLYT